MRTALSSQSIVLALCSLAIAAPASAAGLTLVADGKPQALIVLPDAPSAAAKQAAAVLRDHLREISGATLQIVAEKALGETSVRDGRLAASAQSASAFILVGEGALVGKLGVSSAGVGPGGIRLRTLPNVLALLGPDDKTPSDPSGTLHAVTAFLEQLGCRYLWPGPSGKVVPRRATIIVSDLCLDYSPKILQRKIRDGHYSDRIQVGLDRLGFTAEQFKRLHQQATRAPTAAPDWYAWNGEGGSLDLRSGHAFGRYWEKYGKEHPQWFAMQPNGSRDQSLAGDRARLCKTNPELIEQIAREKIEQLKADRLHHSASLAPNDGGRMTFCMCPECKKLDPPEGRKIQLQYHDTSGARPETKFFEYVSLTDRMIHFYNAVTERVVNECPDALLVADAYSAYSSPPLRAKLHPSVVIRFVPMTYLDEAQRKQDLADWDAWAAAASKIYFRPNCLLAGRREGTLLVYVRRMAEDLRYLAGHHMMATDFDSCAHNWATQGLNYYALVRLLWNPELSADAIIDDYCRSGFGRAAEPVKQYFLRVQELTDQIAQRKLHVTEPFTPEVTAALRQLLDKAKQLAAGDEAILARVAFLRQGLEFTDLQARAYRLTTQQGPVERAQVKQLLEQRAQCMRTIFQENHLAVNVAYVVWGEGFPWRKLGWQWAERK